MTERDDVARRIMGDTCEVFTESPGWEDAHFETFSWCELHNPGAWPEYLTEEGGPVARTWLGGIDAGVCHAAAAAADGILALLPGRTEPSTEVLARAILRSKNSAEFTELAECQGYPIWTVALKESEAILRRLPGRSESEVKAEALYDLAAHMETLPAGTRTIHDPATVRAHANPYRKDQQ